MNAADIILSLAGWLFVINLIPTIIHQERTATCSVPLTTSLSTAAGLIAIAVVYGLLGLPVAAGTTGGTALMWLGIAYQRIVYQ